MRVNRTEDLATVLSVTDLYPDYFTYDFQTWLAEPKNLAYQFEENIGFAELKTPGNYWVHFCFHTARGLEAIKLTKEMVLALYADTQFSSLVGLIWKGNRPARWLIRQVGFKSVGFEETVNGLCEVFVFTKKDLKNDNEF